MTTSNGIFGSEIFSICLAIICIISSGSVIFILLHEYTTLLKGRPFIHFILNIAFCDCFTALTYAWGFPLKGSSLCSAQGFLSIFFSRASWLWTDILITQLYYLVIYNELLSTIPIMHAIVWGISLILQFIPYGLDVEYGTRDDNKEIINNQLCFYKSNGNTEAVKISRYAYFLILTVSLVYILLVCTLISCRSCKGGSLISRDDLRKKMIWYPLGLFIAWIPNMIYNWYADVFLSNDTDLPKDFYVIDNCLTAANSLYGIMLSIFFYTQNIDARRMYYKFFKHNILCIYDDDSDIQKIQMRASTMSAMTTDDRQSVRGTRIDYA